MEPIENTKTENIEEKQPLLGDLLLVARKAQHLDLADISLKLNIKQIYLNALETHEYTAFPNLIFGLAFLRSYAALLHLDIDEMTRLFKQETAHLSCEPAQSPVVKNKDIMPSRRFLFWLFIVLIIVGGMNYVAKTAQFNQNHFFLLQDEEKIVKNDVKQNDVVENKSETLIENTPKIIEPTPEAVPETQEIIVEEAQQVYPPLSGRVLGWAEADILSFVALDTIDVVVKNKDKIVLNTTMKMGDVYNPPRFSKYMTLEVDKPQYLMVYYKKELYGVLDETGSEKKHALIPELYSKSKE